MPAWLFLRPQVPVVELRDFRDIRRELNVNKCHLEVLLLYYSSPLMISREIVDGHEIETRISPLKEVNLNTRLNCGYSVLVSYNRMVDRLAVCRLGKSLSGWVDITVVSLLPYLPLG